MTRANRFDALLAQHSVRPLEARSVNTLQVNVGKLCNQACRHCHVDAGPHQTGADVNMGEEVVEQILRVLRGGGIGTLDITGGAPELSPHFRDLVRGARASGVHVMDRCNLSVLLQPGQQDLAGFLAENEVEVVASLPFYRRDRTDRQRGEGVFDASLQGLRLLNSLGYGHGAGLVLDLVYNPVGTYLPGDQNELESDFKRELQRLYGIVFDHLFAITNMPIARFAEWLGRTGRADAYAQRLFDAFNPSAVDGLMCRDLISVGPDGAIYDCDFNQMLSLPVEDTAPGNIATFDVDALTARRIVTADHCLGCTAGAGSSCRGATG